MGYYSQNPYEQPENPRCTECDEQMLKRSSLFWGWLWICTNSECNNCDYRYKKEIKMTTSIAYELGWSDSHDGLAWTNPYDPEEDNDNYVDYNHGYSDEEFTNDRYDVAGD